MAAMRLAAQPLISTDGLEARLSSMMDMIERQNATIRALESQVHTLTPTAAAMMQMESVNARLSGLEQRLYSIERAITVSGVGGDTGAPMTVGDVVSAVCARVSNLEHAATHALVSRDTMQHALDACAQELKDEVAALREESARRDAVNDLVSAHASLTEQTVALSAMLAQKVDKAEFARLSSTARDLQTFAGFKESAVRDLRTLHDDVAQTRAAVDRTLEGLSRVSGIVTSLAAQTQGKADRWEMSAPTTLERAMHMVFALWMCSSEVHSLNQRLDLLSFDVQQRATAVDVANLQTSLQAAREHVRTLEVAVSTTQERMTSTSASTQERAAEIVDNAKADLDSRLASLRATVDSLMQEVDARAYLTSVEATDDSIRKLAAHVEQLGRSVDLAMKFVTWFSERGEAYEYNAGSLERHMNSLATGNRARVVPTFRELLSSHGASLVPPLTPPPPTTDVHDAAAPGPVTGASSVRVGGIRPPP